jgi:hypothetical protein
VSGFWDASPREEPTAEEWEEVERAMNEHEDRREEFEEASSGERFGFGVCATGRCVEPCGENGGCARGTRRRWRAEP